MKKRVSARILSQREMENGIFDLWLNPMEPGFAEAVSPGQFVGVYTKDRSKLLPRPISICEVSGDRSSLRLVYRRGGTNTGTYSLSLLDGQTCGTVDILGPLGNGFPVEKGKGKKTLIIGGGIGIPPLVELSKRLEARNQIVIGYRDRTQTFLARDLEDHGKLFLATEDGSRGTKGNVVDAVRENQLGADIIYACGPMPMLRAVKALAAELKIPAYISLEEHMACGVGACLGCVVKTKEVHPHTNVNNARICTDGPVFEADQVEI